MNRKKLTGWVVLNIVLLFILGLLCLTPQPAQAQAIGIRGGSYVMIAGAVSGIQGSTLYVTDLNSAKVIAVIYDVNRNGLATIGARDMMQDFR